MRTAPRRASARWAAVGSPLHLALLACTFALAGYAGVRLLAGDRFGVALWFVGAALLHDLVLLPLYAALDRGVVRAFDAAGHRERVMYVRVPAALSALLLLVWFPLISGRADRRYRNATGLPADGFLGRWLLITAVLFAGSALLLVRRRCLRTRLRGASKDRPPTVH